MASDYPGAFQALKRILKKHSAGLVVQTDTPTNFTVITRALAASNQKPLWFGAVMSKKSAVTYHLMALYYNPKLEATISPELKARKQGKSCFNFQRPDPELFAGLDELTRLAKEQWERLGFLEPGTIEPERFIDAYAASGGDRVELARRRAVVRKRAATRRATTRKAKARRP